VSLSNERHGALEICGLELTTWPRTWLQAKHWGKAAYQNELSRKKCGCSAFQESGSMWRLASWGGLARTF